MAEPTPVEAMRYNLAGADKARAAARRFELMKDALKRNGEHAMKVTFRSGVWNLFREGRTITELELDADDARMLAEWMHLRQEQEMKRAAAYEQKALRSGAESGEHQ